MQGLALAHTSDDATALHILDCKVHPAGAVEVLYSAPVPADFIAEGAHGDLYPLRAVETASEDLTDLPAPAAGAPWIITRGPSAELQANELASWSIPDIPTWFVRTPRDEADAEIALNVSGGVVPVRRGVVYRIEFLAAVHRCTAEFQVRLSGADGRVISVTRRQVSVAAPGGRLAADFDKVAIAFEAPEGVESFSLVARKSATLSRQDSYLFVGAPALYALPLSDVTGSTGSAPTRRARLPLPADIVEASRRDFTLHASAGDHAVAIPNLSLGLEGPAARVQRWAFEGNATIYLVLSAAAGAAPPLLETWVDDERSGSAWPTVREEGGLEATLPIDDRHLDGRPHRIEVREAATQGVLLTTVETLRPHITPWAAVRQYAGVASAVDLTPAAPFHDKAYRWWAKAAEAGARIPDLGALHAELLKGFKPRETWPPLAFPKVDKPKVSVVVPAFNKVDVTYYCLCALLFAPNDASFEVIVADDGSEDDTAELETIVSGIKVVRHARTQGFVASCNDGAAQARGDYIVFLNNDTEPTAGWLDGLVSAFEAFEGVGLAGSKLLYPDGTLQEAGGVVWGSGNPWNVGRNGDPADPSFTYLREADYLSGAALMIPRAVWTEVSGFSPEYAPGYFEDTDLAMKVRASGRKVVYAPQSVVIHHEGQSSGVDTASGMKRFQEINRPKFRAKWARLYAGHGTEGVNVHLEKDRGAIFRVLMVSRRLPSLETAPDTIHLIRLIQALGGKVTALPADLAWSPAVPALEAMGVECLRAPWTLDLASHLRANAEVYDLILAGDAALLQRAADAAKANGARARIVFDAATGADPEAAAVSQLVLAPAGSAPGRGVCILPRLGGPSFDPATEDFDAARETLRRGLSQIGVLGGSGAGLVMRSAALRTD